MILPRYVKAEYLDTIETIVDGEEKLLHIWKNPETGQLVAVDNMEIDASRNWIPDPYVDDVRLVFEDTFSGLPK